MWPHLGASLEIGEIFLLYGRPTLGASGGGGVGEWGWVGMAIREVGGGPGHRSPSEQAWLLTCLKGSGLVTRVI